MPYPQHPTLKGRDAYYCDGDYVIVASSHPGCFRVVNMATGEESALYSFHQCKDIINHAKQDKLLGSFDIKA